MSFLTRYHSYVTLRIKQSSPFASIRDYPLRNYLSKNTRKYIYIYIYIYICLLYYSIDYDTRILIEIRESDIPYCDATRFATSNGNRLRTERQAFLLILIHFCMPIIRRGTYLCTLLFQSHWNRID